MQAHKHTCVQTCVHACAHMLTRVRACADTSMHAHTCTHICTHMHTDMCTHTSTHACTHAHICAHTHTHTFTHTHVCAHGLSGVAPFMVTRGARPSHMDGSGLPLHVAAIAKTSSFCEGGRREGPSFLPASRTGLRPRNLLVTKLAQASTGCGRPAQ